MEFRIHAFQPRLKLTAEVCQAKAPVSLAR